MLSSAPSKSDAAAGSGELKVSLNVMVSDQYGRPRDDVQVSTAGAQFLGLPQGVA